jgi:hypothetical protein
MNYSEFLNCVVSESNYTLRRISRDRIGYRYNRLLVPYNVEYSFLKLLESELDLVRSVEILINDVRERYDFNVYDLYSSIQAYSYLTNEK